MEKEQHERIQEIEEKLGYTFKHKGWVITAFTHRSFLNETKNKSLDHNERLEFLGDSILGFMTGEFLFHHLPTSKEGDLSYLRSKLVDATSCFFFIQKLQVQEYVLMGRGERMNEGKGRDTILADLFEAILGAIYLDGGLEEVKSFFFRHFLEDLFLLIKEPSHNFKAKLQDYFQKKFQKQPQYKVMKEEGPDHEKQFHVGVFLEEELLGVGVGLSKKEAEQQAAKQACHELNIE